MSSKLRQRPQAVLTWNKKSFSWHFLKRSIHCWWNSKGVRKALLNRKEKNTATTHNDGERIAGAQMQWVRSYRTKQEASGIERVCVARRLQSTIHDGQSIIQSATSVSFLFPLQCSATERCDPMRGSFSPYRSGCSGEAGSAGSAGSAGTAAR